MTGFGRVHKQFSHYSITVEMKSVNHRFCEVNIRIPRQMMLMEEKLKKLILTYIQRGRVEVFISIEGKALSTKVIQVDWELLDQYYQALLATKERYELHDNITLDYLFRQPELVDIVEKENPDDQLEQNLLHMVEQTVKQLKGMRLAEGKELLHDIKLNLEHIETSCKAVASYAPKVTEQYRERLYKKLADYTEGLVDESRLINEVALFADKADINEEITRITSHVLQFHNTLQGEEEVIGRKLDFLVQELHREINTIGSKANDIFIAEHVVNMKTKLEKIKEQVQNIE
jgi:uncharacterized protein (TIGR00255 family)